jgi:hypothetical protein
MAKRLALVLVALLAVSVGAALPTAHADPVLPNGIIKLAEDGYVQFRLDLQKGDRFEGNFTVSDLRTYIITDSYAIAMGAPHTATFGVDIGLFCHINRQTVLHFDPQGYTQYFFNYTAEYSDEYLVDFYCSRNLFGDGVIMPKVNLCYDVIEANPFKLQILSPLAQTYKESNLSLSYTSNKEINGISAINYTLDKNNSTILNGNTTIAGLSNGKHNITVSGTDIFGYTDNQTVTFTVDNPNVVYSFWIIAIVVAATCTLTGVLLYGSYKSKKSISLSKK